MWPLNICKLKCQMDLVQCKVCRNITAMKVSQKYKLPSSESDLKKVPELFEDYFDE